MAIHTTIQQYTTSAVERYGRSHSGTGKRVKAPRGENAGKREYMGNHLSNLQRRVSGGYFAGCFHIHSAAAREKPR